MRLRAAIAADDYALKRGAQRRRTTMMRIAAALLGALLCTVVEAQAPRTVFLEDLTWIELRDDIKAGRTVILVPIGGTEQNGPHMALGKHNVRARVFAEKIAAVLGDALVAPVMAYVPEGRIDPPTAHMRFPGTITVPEDAFEKVLESAARSFRRHGFKDIVFLGDHGGYQKSLKNVADRLNREWAAGPARVHALEDYYRAAEREYGRALAEKGYTQAEIGTHAGLADTSLTLAIDPRLVRMDRLDTSGKPGEQGVQGDPRRSSVELGRLGERIVIDRTVAAIRTAIARR
jgi:creatinine amidohydrolase